jgi:hypothetical protein
MTKRLESFWALRKTDKIDGQGFCESVILSVAKKLTWLGYDSSFHS